MVIIKPLVLAGCLLLFFNLSHGSDQFGWLREAPIPKPQTSVSSKSPVVKPSAWTISNKNSRVRSASISNKPTQAKQNPASQVSEEKILLRIEKLKKELAALQAGQKAE